MRKIGFTGTRNGMTVHQFGILSTYADSSVELHHGDCIGSDAEAAVLFKSKGARVVKHPPFNTKHQAFTTAHEERKPKEYLARNRDIVDETGLLIACPVSMKESDRSGTWFTIRYARQRRKPITIIFPNGRMEFENMGI